MKTSETAEGRRLVQRGTPSLSWKHWGPYVSERAWATVREDYSPDGGAWDFLTHDMARSKAYRWGEDGLAAICDRYQVLCFSVALWNGKDPILKERAFGLTPAEGNHGEDVKEYYFYLDSTPTHSYMKYLYKYPQAEFPYGWLVDENRQRNGNGPEFELLDTGVFKEDRYFDVFVELAKATEEDICIRIEAINRGPDTAPLHIIPQLWFRNTWAWTDPLRKEPLIAFDGNKKWLSLVADDNAADSLEHLPFDYKLGKRYLFAQSGAEALFTNNESNNEKLYNVPNRKPYVKDAFHAAIVQGKREVVNPQQSGTKACLDYSTTVAPNRSFVALLRLTPQTQPEPLKDVEKVIAARRAEADDFYASIHPPNASEDERMVQRQALAGLLWSKQAYLFDVNVWLDGDNPKVPPPASRRTIRNHHWQHLNSMRVLLMPDKWEYPWFAAWDLAFQATSLALIDPEFSKEQLWFLLFEQFQHPNGQIPAYEWEFSDLNPPVHAWAVWRVYNMDRLRSGRPDREWLERCFHKLLINFAWWVNKVDSSGNNVFEGGFLGLDNITVIDRSEKLPGGAVLEQSDATGWMGMFCLNLMRISLELAREDKAYESLATKFFQHYIYIGAAMNKMGGRDYSLWDESDGFFYDILRYPDGAFHKFRVRSLVGVIPLFAVERLELDWIEPFHEFRDNFLWFVNNRRELAERCCHYREHDRKKVYVLTVASERKLRGLIERLFDPAEFLSEFGIRSLSKFHEQHPFVYGKSEVRYEPGEAVSKIKGGNSNWRGPIWFPTSFLLIESLRKLGAGYGAGFELKAGTGERTLSEMADELANRLIRIFTRDRFGTRPVYGGNNKFQQDPHWRDLILFHEYFHGDTGVGLGASHQTGWTALVANLIDEWRK